MEENIQVSLDKLPIKCLDVIEENENEVKRFLHKDLDCHEKRLSLIRRIDFAWAVVKDDKKKKQKKTSKEASEP